MNHAQQPNRQQQSLLRHYENSEFRQQRRSKPRKSCRIPVTFSFGSEEHCAELMENISLEGAFIRTDVYFFPGEEVTVSIPFASRKKQVRVRGKVVRHNAQGIGIKFEKRPGSPTKAK
jgi:hypothetical protein